MSAQPWSVLFINLNPLFGEGLARIIATNRRFCIAATLSSTADIDVPSLPRDCPVLLVLSSRGEPTATVRDITAFKQKVPDARIVILAEDLNPDHAIMSFRAGAHAYLPKLACYSTLIKSLELVIDGESILISALLPSILDQWGLPGENEDRTAIQLELTKVEVPRIKSETGDIPSLSSRERSVLTCIVVGDSNKVIARRIGATEATVKVHIKSILRKIRVLNRTQAAIWATRHPLEFAPDEALTNTRSHGSAPA